MNGNPPGDWRALSERYRSMFDEELIELSADFGNLTPAAQLALRDEMRLRKLSDPQAPRRIQSAPAAIEQQAGTGPGRTQFGFSLVGRTPDLIPNEPTQQSPDGAPVEYTWKTPLCSCAGDQQAWQISETLRRAGIESWIEGAGSYATSSGSQDIAVDDGNRRVVVAADQLDEARAIVAQPIPADIVEQSKAPPSEYQVPICPSCGAEDPLLESVDPVNAWTCEVCGAEWTDEHDERPQNGAG